MSPKDTAVSFLQLVTSGKIREAYQRHVAPGFRHHNPYFRGNAKSLQSGMEENETRFPGKLLKIQRAIAERDLVAVHSHVTLKQGELEMAVVHLFRFQGEQIVELWDIGQQVPTTPSPNENGMF
ncbi:MAG: nuclear transport factor 2 family protein [Bdellovibrionota bacterium]